MPKIYSTFFVLFFFFKKKKKKKKEILIMATHDFSIEYLAMSLIVRLDRRNIFPPLHNNPESFLSSVGSISNLSSYRPKRPPNAFLICRKNVQEESKSKGTYNMRIISKV